MMMGVLAACSGDKEEPTISTPITTPTPVVKPVVEEIPIGFSAAVDNSATTRGDNITPVYGGTLDNNQYVYNSDANNAIYDSNVGFGVFAIYTGNSTYRSNPSSTEERQIVMRNQKVSTSDSGTTWTYSPLRFWPGNASNISFFAYAPYRADGEFAFPTSDDIGPGQNDPSVEYKYFKLDGNNKLKAPTVTWNHSSQKDLVYGVANADVEDVNGVKIKSAGDDYTDMHRPKEGKLPWKLKHALARAKFTITDYMQYGQQLSATSISLPRTYTVYSYEGDETFIDDDSEELIPYKGDYINFTGEEYFHKFSRLERRLIITEVSFSHLNKSGNLVLMNEVANNEPVWENVDTYTGEGNDVYKITPLNPLIGVNYESYESAFDGLVTDDNLPLNVALKKEGGKDVIDDTKQHYVLLMPQKYNSQTPIRVTVKYKICTYVKLEHNFSWTYGKPEHIHFDEIEAYNEEYLLEEDETSISGPLQFDIEANKTFNILITLGKLMNVSYELTDWDDEHIIYIPDFE